jgi:hypothetical protein
MRDTQEVHAQIVGDIDRWRKQNGKSILYERKKVTGNDSDKEGQDEEW